MLGFKNMKIQNKISEYILKAYAYNRKIFKIRGAYKALKILSPYLPYLKKIPISFNENGKTYVDVNDPDTFWILNHYLGDVHPSMMQIYRIGELVITPGDTIWDVGANMGFLSWHFAKNEFELHQIHHFEPLKKPFTIASDLLSGVQRVKLHNIGLGDKNESLCIYHGEGGTGDASIKLITEAQKASLHSEFVQIKRGDDIIDELKSDLPSFIKIDVEGYECEVLRGIQNIIKIKQPVIIFEILFLKDDEIERAIPYGYKIAFINEHTGDLIHQLEDARKIGVMDAILAPKNSEIWRKL